MNTQRTWVAEITVYCRQIGVTPSQLIKEHKELSKSKKPRKEVKATPNSESVWETVGNMAYFNFR